MENTKKPAGKIVVSAILLSKPGIILSVAFTGFAGMVVARKGIPDSEIIFFGLISLLFSAAGSAILNNILDKGLDEKMERLNKRVQALETLGDKNAVLISTVLILISLVVSFGYLNIVNTTLIILAILSYTLLYTLFLKRSSPFGTILGGIPGALPVLIGYTAVRPGIGIEGVILFTFMMLWQPPHFWALAQKYKDDYSKAGIPVMPVVFGSKYTDILILLYSMSLIPLCLTLWLTGLSSEYFAVFSLLAGGYFEYTVIKSIIKKDGYGQVFSTSIIYLLLIMCALIIDIALNQSIPVSNVISADF